MPACSCLQVQWVTHRPRDSRGAVRGLCGSKASPRTLHPSFPDWMSFYKDTFGMESQDSRHQLPTSLGRGGTAWLGGRSNLQEARQAGERCQGPFCRGGDLLPMLPSQTQQDPACGFPRGRAEELGEHRENGKQPGRQPGSILAHLCFQKGPGRSLSSEPGGAVQGEGWGGEGGV